MTSANDSNTEVARGRVHDGSSNQSTDLHWAWQALNDVIDPELGLDVVSLGLVYDIRDEGGTVLVEMTLTTPGCPASESLSAMAGEAVAQAGARDIDSVVVRLVWDPPWSPSMIDEHAAAQLGIHLRHPG